MATDMGRGIIAPDSNDNISTTGVAEMRTLGATSAAALDLLEEETTWHRGLVPTDTNIDSFRGRDYAGDWYVGNPVAVRGLPSGVAQGNLIVTAGPAGYSYTTQVYVQARDERLTMSRTMVSGSDWSPWEVHLTSGRFVPESADLDDYYGYQYASSYYIATTTLARTIGNLPVVSPGILFVLSGQSGYNHTVQMFTPIGAAAAEETMYWRSSSGSRTWHRWKPLGGPDPLVPENVGLKNKDLLDLFVARKGGSIGTGGKAAFALRVDHGTVAFRDHVAPLLKTYGLPATMAVYSKQREISPDKNGVEWSAVESWHRTHGVTFGNHSDDHLDKPDAAGWHGGTIGSQQELKALMPSVPVEQYIPHGSVGYDRYGGFNQAGSHEQIVGTVAGQMALSSHALTTGYRGSLYRKMTGQPVQGLRHWTMESSTVSTFKTMVDRAIAHNAGFAVMFHPEFIGVGDRMTWEDIDQCLAYVAEMRDAGLLVPLTLDGLAVADVRNDYRDDLVAEPVSAATSHTLDLDRRDHYLGGSRVGQWHVTTTGSAEVALRVAPTGSAWEATRRVTIDTEGDHVLYLPFGIPLDHRGNLTMTVEVISGSVQVRETHAYTS